MTVVFVLALVALLSLDAVHFGQWGFSRPICVAPAVGTLLGEPAAGFWIGAWLELVWVTIIPIGHYALPEMVVASAASVVAVHAWGASESLLPETAAALAFGVPWGFLGRRIDTAGRARVATWGKSWYAGLEASAETASPPPLAPLLLRATALKAASSAAVIALAWAVAELAAPLATRLLSVAFVRNGFALAASFLPLVGTASLGRVFHCDRRPIPFVAGLVLGAAFGVWSGGGW